MKPKNLFFVLFTIILFAFIYSCSTVPLTGRQQLNFIPNSTMNATSFQQYSEFLKTNKVVNSSDQKVIVQRVGGRIKEAVEQYFKQQGQSDQLNGYQWEFNLVDNNEINAWCMPGGKVVVYTGILKVAKSESELAVVMGHEIAHAVAQHGSERMSQMLLMQMGGMALDKALENKPEETRQLWGTAFGVGAQLGVLLPYSRTHEYESDELGLIFMAIAGYNPETAVTFWQNMAKLGGSKPPEFISTHPSDENRIKAIRDNLPKAMPYYKK